MKSWCKLPCLVHQIIICMPTRNYSNCEQFSPIKGNKSNIRLSETCYGCLLIGLQPGKQQSLTGSQWTSLVSFLQWFYTHNTKLSSEVRQIDLLEEWLGRRYWSTLMRNHYNNLYRDSFFTGAKQCTFHRLISIDIAQKEMDFNSIIIHYLIMITCISYEIIYLLYLYQSWLILLHFQSV